MCVENDVCIVVWWKKNEICVTFWHSEVQQHEPVTKQKLLFDLSWFPRNCQDELKEQDIKYRTFQNWESEHEDLF